MESDLDEETILLYEKILETARAKDIENPNDVENLLDCAGALLTLYNVKDFTTSKEMLEEAITKFKKVIELNPNLHRTFWGLGKALTAQAVLFSTLAEAKGRYELAYDYFLKAVEKNPKNTLYRISLEEAAKKAPGRGPFTSAGFKQSAGTADPSSAGTERSIGTAGLSSSAGTEILKKLKDT